MSHILIFLSIIFASHALASEYPDVNGDRLVNAQDALTIIEHIERENPTFDVRLDLNQDGSVTAADANIVITFMSSSARIKGKDIGIPAASPIVQRNLPLVHAHDVYDVCKANSGNTDTYDFAPFITLQRGVVAYDQNSGSFFGIKPNFPGYRLNNGPTQVYIGQQGVVNQPCKQASVAAARISFVNNTASPIASPMAEFMNNPESTFGDFYTAPLFVPTTEGFLAVGRLAAWRYLFATDKWEPLPHNNITRKKEEQFYFVVDHLVKITPKGKSWAIDIDTGTTQALPDLSDIGQLQIVEVWVNGSKTIANLGYNQAVHVYNPATRSWMSQPLLREWSRRIDGNLTRYPGAITQLSIVNGVATAIGTKRADGEVFNLVTRAGRINLTTGQVTPIALPPNAMSHFIGQDLLFHSAVTGEVGVIDANTGLVRMLGLNIPSLQFRLFDTPDRFYIVNAYNRDGYPANVLEFTK